MAKAKVKKSDAIREAMSQNPKMKVMEVVKHLADKGIKVLPNHVYSIRGKKPKRGRPVGSPVPFVASNNGVTSPVKAIQKVKSLAQEFGGMRGLKQLVDELVA